MTRRTKNKKKSVSVKAAVSKPAKKTFLRGKSFRLLSENNGGQKSGTKHGNNMRFNVSLIILTAALEMSLFILLIALIGNQMKTGVAGASPSLKVLPAKVATLTGGKLSDPNLDYELTIPAQTGEWLYKTGSIKSVADDQLSDQYLQIFLPVSGNTKSRNFEDVTKVILTIKKFTSNEWKKMDAGCKKDNQLSCEAMGTKIAEQNDNVYAYIKANNCSKLMEVKCNQADKIIQSFNLKQK